MATRSYAKGTTVDTSTSQAEIMRALTKFGIKQKAFFEGEEDCAVAFSYGGISYRISILMPSPSHEAFRFTEGGKPRSQEQATVAYDAEIRRRWRSLVLAVKAQLVAVDDQIATFEQAFLAYAVTGDGRTVGDHVIPQLKAGAQNGAMPLSLPMPGGK